MKGKVLITGGAGFIGSNIAERLSGKRPVTVLDNLSTGYEDNLAGLDVRLIKGDICDRGQVEAACCGVESIFHLAAQISVPLSMEDPLETVRINNLGTLNILEAAAQCGVKHIAFSSSAAVYGDNPLMPKKEDMLPEPNSPYAVSKLDGEHYLKIYSEVHGLHAVALRYFNVFGPRQSPHSAYAAAVPAFIYRALTGEDIQIFGDGEQTRDFVFIEDVVQANLLAAGIDVPAPAEASGKVFNVACGRSISINDLVEMIKRITDSSSKIVHTSERAGDIRHSLADVSLIRQSLGFEADSDLEGGVVGTVASLKGRGKLK